MAEELRRSYHDRIADLRAQTIIIVSELAIAVRRATAALVGQDVDVAAAVTADAADTLTRVPIVEAEVLDMLALQAPVARDLRVILASLRIAQVGELCLGLVTALAARVRPDDDLLSPSLRKLVDEVGGCAGDLFEDAARAWRVVDAGMAAGVVSGAEGCRRLGRLFLAEVISSRDLPVETALDMGLVARAYERLTDHAVEIAGRVIFVATGTTP